MADAYFKLKNDKAEETSIQLFYFHNGTRIVYGSGISILPDLWNPETKLPTKDKNKLTKWQKVDPQIRQKTKNKRKRLEKIKTKFEALVENRTLKNKKIDFDKIKHQLDLEFKDNVVKRKKKKNKEEFNQYIDRYIKEIESGDRLTSKKTIYQKSTVKSYNEWQTQINNFQKDKKKKLRFKDITIDTYDDIVTYFQKKKYRQNTIGKIIKILKAVMNASHDEGLHDFTEHRRKKFSTLKVNTEAIYLTEDQLLDIYKLDLSKDKNLEICRDVFLCGCWSLQRFSDYSKFHKDQLRIEGDKKFLDVIQKKGKVKVSIPLNPDIDSILKKYDYTLPKIYEQKLNENIKTICESANINDSVSVVETIGGREVIQSYQRFKLVQSHTARRTGCTNMFLAGFPLESIRLISGHATTKVLQNYIKVTREENARILSMNEYFNKSVVNE